MTLTRLMLFILWFPYVAAVSQKIDLGTARIFVVTEIGTPVRHAKVRIEGGSLERTVEIHGTTLVSLPFGVYTFSCSHPTLASGFKVVRIEMPYPIDVIFGLPLANPGQVAGEGDFSPFEVSGRITPGPTTAFARVKVVGVFTEDSADASIDGSGRFRLVLRNEGTYRLFVLYGEEIVSEQTLNLTFAIPRKVMLEIRADERSPRKLKR